MQGQIKIFKITSKKFPDKEWDSVNHFTNFNDDRQIIKKNAKYKKTNSTSYQWLLANGGYFTKSILDDSKKNIIKIEMGDSRVIAHHNNTYDQPHIEKGILEIKELLSLDINLNTLKQLVDFLNKNSMEEKEWKELLQQIK